MEQSNLSSHPFAALPLFALCALVLWMLKRPNALRMQKQDLLNQIASHFGGHCFESHAEFSFEGTQVEVFLSDPVQFGSDHFRQVAPGFLAVKCIHSSKNPARTSNLLILESEQSNYPEFRESLSRIFQKGFHEIEIAPDQIQVRKLNILLTEKFKDEFIKDLVAILPAIIQLK